MVYSHDHAKIHEDHLPLKYWEERLIGMKLVWDGTYKLADDESVC